MTQLGGVTLTTSLLYLTLSIHQRNRAEQALLLRQQSLVLRNIIEPLPPAPEPTARQARVSVFDSAKDMWNREIEAVVRKVQYTDWAEVRDQMERGAGRVWGNVREGVKEVGKQADEKVKEPVVAEITGRGREG
jgi:altered-inheritance-of-mitochondria protein 5